MSESPSISNFIEAIDWQEFKNKPTKLEFSDARNDFFTLSMLTSMLYGSLHDFSYVRFAKANNKYLGHYRDFCSAKKTTLGTRYVMDMDEVEDLLHQGATLVLDKLERIVPSMGDLATKLELRRRMDVGFSAYYSRSDATSFGAHFDSHDVLVVQIHGTKTWRIYKPSHLFPIIGSKHHSDIRPSGQPDYIVETKEMSALYIPMGYWHEAITNDTSSLHVSILVNQPRVIDLIYAELAKLENEYFFRQPIHGKLTQNQQVELKERLMKFVLESNFQNESNKQKEERDIAL